MSSEYDVIIVGSGAGGGTLAHRLAPSGKRDPDPGARRLAASRDRELGREGDLRRQPLRLRRHLVRRTGQAVPAADPLLRRRRHEVLRGCLVPPSRERLRGAQAPRRHLAGVAGRLRRVRALLHPGRAAVPSARSPRRGPVGAAGKCAVPAPAGVPRAAHPGALRRPRGRRAAPLPRAVRCHARRGEPGLQRLHPMRDVRRLRVPGPRQVRRRGDRGPSRAGALQRDARAQRRGSPPGDRSHRTNRDRCRRGGRRSGATVLRIGGGGVGRRRQLRQAVAGQRERQAPERPRQRVGPGGPQLRLPQQPGVPGGVEGGERHPVPEDVGPQRLLLR